MTSFFGNIKKGALRKQLGVPSSRGMPQALLEKIAEKPIGQHVYYRGSSFKVTPKLKKRAVFALNAKRGWK